MNPARDLSRAQARNVLCVVGWWPDQGSVAGIFIKEHVQAIADHSTVSVVYVEVHKHGRPWPTRKVRRSQEDGLTVYRVTIGTPLRRAGIAEALVRSAYRTLIRELHEERSFDVIHVHVRTEVTAQVLGMARELDLPVMVTEHNSFYHLGIKALPKSEQKRERNGIRKWFSDPRIKAVMPVSRDLANVLCNEYGVDRGIVSVIPNIASDVFSPGVRPDAPPFRVVLAAVWRPPKDHKVFIEALTLMESGERDRLYIDWVGYGPDMDMIRSLCRANLPDMPINFPGLLKKEALAELVRSAHLFVLPTTADNLPCVVLESLCCGTPVISMNVNGLPELITEKNGILVPPSDPMALAAAIQRFMATHDRFDHADIAHKARGMYSANAVAARLEQVYHGTLVAHQGWTTKASE